MTEQVFRLTPRARRQAKRAPFIFGLVWGLLVGLLSLRGHGAGAWVGALVFFAIGLVPVTVFVIAQLTGRTVVTADGLRLRGLFRRRFVPWERVRSVDPHKGGRGFWVVKVQLTDGRKRRLPGFYTESAQDAEYEAQVRDVRFAVREALAGLPGDGR